MMNKIKDQRSEAHQLREYRPGDETAIAGLFSVVFGAGLSEAQWRWKYAGAARTPPLARLAFDCSGQLVGHAGAMPLRGWRQNQPLPFFQICDVMVHPDARGPLGGRNLFTRLIKELAESLADRWPDAFAYGFPGQRPFRLGEYIRAYGRVEPASAIRRPARFASFSLVYTRPLDWQDPRLDPLWTRLASSFALGLIRDRTFLDWRYAANPFHAYELLGFYIAGQLLGWAVVRRDRGRLQVIDLLVARRWLKPVLAALDRAATRRGVDEVEIWLPRQWRELSGGRPELTDVVVGNLIWRFQIPTAEVRETLYYTMGDLDIF